MASLAAVMALAPGHLGVGALFPLRTVGGVAGVASLGLFAVGLWNGLWAPASAAVGLVGAVVPTLLGRGGAWLV